MDAERLHAAIARTAVTETADDIMRRMSTENPRSRYHQEETNTGRSSWSCIPIRDAVEARAALLQRAAPAVTETDRPTIDCLCGDIFPTVEAFHEHIHLSHPEADMPEPAALATDTEEET